MRWSWRASISIYIYIHLSLSRSSLLLGLHVQTHDIPFPFYLHCLHLLLPSKLNLRKSSTHLSNSSIPYLHRTRAMTRDILAWRRRDAAKPPPLLEYRSSYLFTLVTISVAVFTVRLSMVFFFDLNCHEDRFQTKGNPTDCPLLRLGYFPVRHCKFRLITDIPYILADGS